MTKIIVFPLLFVLVYRCTALTTLTAESYAAAAADGDVWLIKVASKYCGSCEEFAPVFK